MAVFPRRDSDASKGAVDLHANFAAQLPHREAGRPGSDFMEGEDTDFPEPGSNAEHSGEKYGAREG